MPKVADLTKVEFDGLKVLRLAAARTVNGGARWVCLCKCGAEFTTRATSLVSKHTESCGCRKEIRTHGRTKTPEYGIWSSIKKRCTNKKFKYYKDYGGRGITLAPAWYSFARFYADMGARPSKNHTVERRDNNRSYTAENCYWATRKEQGRNKRNNRILSFQGRDLCLTAWAELKGISKDRLWQRLEAGWTVEDALTTPVRAKCRKGEKRC